MFNKENYSNIYLWYTHSAINMELYRYLRHISFPEANSMVKHMC